jgi:hypothetical protein
MSEANDPDDGCVTNQSNQIDSLMRYTLQRSIEIQEQTLDVVKSILDEFKQLSGQLPLPRNKVSLKFQLISS